MRLKRLLFVAIIPVMVSGAAAFADEEPIAGLDSFVRQSMAARGVPGLALGIIKDGKVICAKGYGVRKLGGTEPVDEKTVFSLGSMTKAFTAAACAILIDEDALSWTTPVREILPRFKLKDRCATEKATLTDILCMRTGLPTISTLVAFSETDQDIFKLLPHVQPAYDFRAGWSYSNECYRLAGECVAAKSGQDWHTFVKRRIFDPLQMTSTTSDTTQITNSGNVAAPHAVKDGKLQAVERFHLVYGAPAGSIDSNLSDVLKWVAMQLNDGKHQGVQIVSASGLSKMHSPQQLAKVPVPQDTVREFDSYGFGWIVQDVEGTKVVSHGGNILGMASMAVLVPKHKLGVVVLCNRDGTDERDVLAKKILMHYIDGAHENTVLANVDPQKPEPKIEPSAVNMEFLKKTLTGTYKNAAFGEITVGPAAKTGFEIRYGKLVGELVPIDGRNFSVDWNLPISDGRSLYIWGPKLGSRRNLVIDEMTFVK
jgi:CubicO group peptidase (beta-lactamase class C family)